MLIHARDMGTGSAMNERQLIDEVMTLVVDGHATAASILNGRWYRLSQHRDVEARLCTELAAQAHDMPPNLAQMEGLAYARQVLTANGTNANRGCSASRSGVNRSGSKLSGSFQ